MMNRLNSLMWRTFCPLVSPTRIRPMGHALSA